MIPSPELVPEIQPKNPLPNGLQPSPKASENQTSNIDLAPKPRSKYKCHGLKRVDVAVSTAVKLATFDKQLATRKMLTELVKDMEATEPQDENENENEMRENTLKLGLLMTEPQTDSESDEESDLDQDSDWESEKEEEQTDSDEDEDERAERKAKKAKEAALESLKVSNDAVQDQGMIKNLKRSITTHPQAREWLRHAYPSDLITDEDFDKMKMKDSDLGPILEAVSEFLFALNEVPDPDQAIEVSEWRAILTESPWASHFSEYLADTLFMVARTKKLKSLTMRDLCQLYCWLGPGSLHNHPSLIPVNHIIPFISYLTELKKDVWPVPFEGLIKMECEGSIADVMRFMQESKFTENLLCFDQGRTLLDNQGKMTHLYRSLAFLNAKNVVSPYTLTPFWNFVKKQMEAGKAEAKVTGRPRYRFQSNASAFEIIKEMVKQLGIFYGLQHNIAVVTPENCLAAL